MIKIGRIMVPTDFSENADLAIDYAQELAARFEAEVFLAHVSPLTIYPLGYMFGPVVLPNVEEEIRQSVDEGMAKLKERFGSKITVKILYAQGTAFVELIRLARENDIDLIIMSTHGHSGLKHALLGSTTERVVRKAPCPVLTVRPGEREFVLP